MRRYHYRRSRERQRHAGARCNRIELARQQHRETSRLADAPGRLAGLIARAEIKIGASRTDNCGAGGFRMMHHGPRSEADATFFEA